MNKRKLQQTAKLVKKANDSMNIALCAIMDLYKLHGFDASIYFEENDIQALAILLKEIYEKKNDSLTFPENEGFYSSEFQQFGMLMNKIQEIAE